jgi:isopentenyldiphosphate isomerase
VSSELLERCDASGCPLGPVPREICHGNPAMIHMVVHLHVFDEQARLLLQKRSAAKELYPGRWDTAVGGHVGAGEGVLAALLREAREELDLDAAAAKLLYTYLHANAHESEYVHTFVLTSSGPFRPHPEEIDEVRSFSVAEMEAMLGRGTLTPNFEDELARLAASGAFLAPRA